MHCLKVARYWPSILLDVVDGCWLEGGSGKKEDLCLTMQFGILDPWQPQCHRQLPWQLDRGPGISRRLLTNDPPRTNLSSEKIVFGVVPNGSKVEKNTFKNGRLNEVS